MWMTNYIAAVKRGFRDQHGMTPDAGSSNYDPIFSSVPDGVYDIVVEGRLDHVRIENGTINCCNFDTPASVSTSVSENSEKVDRYFLKAHWQEDWQAVTKEEWIRAERSAGFRPKGLAFNDPKYKTTCATGGFTGGGVAGMIKYA